MSKQSLKSVLVITLVTFVAHYLFFTEFGLYEDDYSNVPSALDTDFSTLLTGIKNSLTHWPQGHPLSFLPFLFTHIAMITGGFHVLYIIGFFILTINSILFYFLLKKIFPDSEMFALTGALILCLFPPDTAKILLTHTYVLQMSLMFLITASLLYLNNRKVLSYIIITCSLFSYESAFIVFFGIPFLNLNRERKLKSEIFSNAAILGFIIVVYSIIRRQTGEPRLIEMSQNLFETIYKIAASVIIGPAMNLYLFIRAPLVTIMHWDIAVIAVSLVCLIFFVWIYRKLSLGLNTATIKIPLKIELKLFRLSGEGETTSGNLKLIKIIGYSFILLWLAYVLSFTHFPPTSAAGRLTSVHLAATFGASILFAGISTLLFSVAGKLKVRIYFLVMLSLYLSLLTGYRVLIQKDFARSWDDQKNFWTEVIRLCPDLNENTVIFVTDSERLDLSSTTYITTNNYTDQLILNLLYKFPADWENPPRLFFIKGSLEDRTELMDGELKWKVPASARAAHWEAIPDSNVIILSSLDNGESFVRIDSTLTLKGKTITLKQRSQTTVDTFPANKLTDFLIKKD